MLVDYLKVFLVGGVICLIAQVLMDYFKMQTPYVLVSYVTAGVILTFLGVYEPIVKFGGSGATVPIIGFGYSLANGAKAGIAE
ncbi:SpoVA/SpoVAEb family sporulation membrane protein, partial [Romboutsia sp.]|uniref:SpoVA/SpoVAEb family sporulation membrane protein n=1 Tax=Romboutsia sp. TaxID=1965302 RepID=UPI003F2A1849